MKNRSPIKNTFTVLLAVLTLLSTTGLAIDAHYCKNKLANISFLGKAKSCTPLEIAPTKSCSNAGTPQLTKQLCCTHQNLYSKATIVAVFAAVAKQKTVPLQTVAAPISLPAHSISFQTTINFYLPPLPSISKRTIAFQNIRV